MNSKRNLWMVVTCVAIGLIGCDNGGTPSGDGQKKTGDDDKKVVAAALPASLFLTEAPADAIAVPKLKESAKEGDEVTVRVVIGGREAPFVAKRAIMTVVDSGLANQCLSPDDGCGTPWDYCCASPEQLKPNLATVQFVDGTNATLDVDLSASKLKPGSTVVVRGVIGPRPDPDALIINATGIYVETKS